MNDSTYLMMVYFSLKHRKNNENNTNNNDNQLRQNSKVNFNNQVFIEDDIIKPENNQKKLKGILKNCENH
jgi:hypothetical protein